MERETGATTARGRRPLARRGIFTRDLRMLLYAFGDVAEPRRDTINCLEDVVLEFLTDLASRTRSLARNPRRIKVDDLRQALGRPVDGKKLARAEELLYMATVIQNSRKLFEPEADQDDAEQQQQQQQQLSQYQQHRPVGQSEGNAKLPEPGATRDHETLTNFADSSMDMSEPSTPAATGDVLGEGQAKKRKYVRKKAKVVKTAGEDANVED